MECTVAVDPSATGGCTAADVHSATRRILASRQDPLPAANDSHVSLLTYNILSHHHVRCEGFEHTMFHHASEEVLSWEGGRKDRVVDTVLAANADIVCLQEMGLEAATKGGEALLPAWAARPFQEAGYECILQDDRKRSDSQETANALLFKSDRFELVGDTDHRSRSMIVWLRQRGKPSLPLFAVCNVHLEGHPEKHKERRSQLDSTLKSVEKHLKKPGSEPAHVIVAGDFNSSIVNVPLSDLLGSGTPFGLSEAFPESAGPQLGGWTESGGGAGKASAVDHVLLSDALQITALRPVLDVTEEIDEVAEVQATGLPSAKHASDHLPLALVILPYGPPVSLNRASAEETSKAHISPLASKEEEVELLTKWGALRAEAPEKPKGKPSQEVIEQLKMHKQREEAFLAELPEDVAKWLKKCKVG